MAVFPLKVLLILMYSFTVVFDYDDPLDIFPTKIHKDSKNNHEIIKADINFNNDFLLVKHIINSIVEFSRRTEQIHSTQVNLQMLIPSSFINDWINYSSNNQFNKDEQFYTEKVMLLKDFIKQSTYTTTKQTDRIKDGLFLSVIILYAFIITLIIVAFIKLVLIRMKICYIILLMIVFQEVIIEWIRLYQNALSNRMLLHQNASENVFQTCSHVTQSYSYMAVLKQFFGMFKFETSNENEKCQLFLYQLNIDPLIDISISEALTNSFHKIMTKNVVQLFKMFSMSITAFLSVLPVQWQWVTFFFSMIIIILTIIFKNGIEFRSMLMSISIGNKSIITTPYPSKENSNYSFIKPSAYLEPRLIPRINSNLDPCHSMK